MNISLSGVPFPAAAGIPPSPIFSTVPSFLPYSPSLYLYNNSATTLHIGQLPHTGKMAHVLLCPPEEERGSATRLPGYEAGTAYHAGVYSINTSGPMQTVCE